MPNGSSKRRALRIGLTGGIGSGKSTVLSMFRALGADVLDADAIVHRLLACDRSVLIAIRNRFGDGVFRRTGQLDRKVLAARVFRNAADRRFLERLIHPRVRREMDRAARASRKRVVVADVPLLFESGWVRRFDRVVVVAASRPVRLRRLAKKGFLRAEALRRMKAQWPMRRKEQRADFVIDNNGSLRSTRRNVKNVWNEITRHG